MVVIGGRKRMDEREITAFTDCGSKSIVVRVPYEMIVKILKYLPHDKDYEALLSKVKKAAQRSNKLNELLKEL